MMQERIKQLQTELRALIEWKNTFSRIQVKHPLDEKSVNLIRERLLVPTGKTEASMTADIALEVEAEDGTIYWLIAEEL